MPARSADAIVVAAGSSARMAGADKLLASIGGPTAACPHARRARRGRRSVARLVVVTTHRASARPSKPRRGRPSVRGRPSWPAARSGKTRSAPGSSALDAARPIPTGRRVVLVHDGARPRVVERAGDVGGRGGRASRGGHPGRAGGRDAQAGGMATRVARRSTAPTLAAAQTPQGVRRGLLREAPGIPAAGEGTWTDEAALLEACSIAVHVVPGDPANLKVTVPADLASRRRPRWRVPLRAPHGHRAATPIRSGRASRCVSAASRSPARRGCTVTPTGTWCSTPSPTRCSGRPGWATSAGCSRPARRRRAGSTAASCSPAVVARLAEAGWRPVARRPDRSSRPGRASARHLDAMRTRSRRSSALDARMPSTSRRRPATSTASEGAGRSMSALALATIEAPRMSGVRLHDTLTGETRPLEPLRDDGSASTRAARPCTAPPTSATSARSCSRTCSSGTCAGAATASAGS